jgi:uncharacterized protein
MALDLKRVISPEIDKVLPSMGSLSNMQHLAGTVGVSLAMVQSDVLRFYAEGKDYHGKGKNHKDYDPAMVQLLRVMFPLHIEELHVLVRKDSSIKYLHEIRGKKIFMSGEESGSYVTGNEIYKLLFDGEKPKDSNLIVDPEDFRECLKRDPSSSRDIALALEVLSGLKTHECWKDKIDVVFLVGGQPYGVIKDMAPKLKAVLRFVAFDPKLVNTTKLDSYYSRAVIDAPEYGELTDGRPVSTLAVQSYLVAVQLQNSERRKFLKRFAQNYCQNFSALTADPKSHQKWRKVNWTPGRSFPKLVTGWRRSEALDGLSECGVKKLLLPRN